MKKLIIINLILISLIYILPKEEIQRVDPEVETVEVEELTEEIAEIKVTTRGLEEPRQKNINTYSDQCVELIKKYERL